MTAKAKKSNYGEFFDPSLVAIYDTVNPIDSYRSFYVDMATQFSAESVIDIGCGTGLLAKELSDQNHKVTGIEPSQEMLNIARGRHYDTPVKFIEGSALNLRDQCVDLVIMTGHVAQFYLDDIDWQTALKNIFESLKPGGHFVFESRNPLLQPFTTWPTKLKHTSLNDTKAGKIEWWCDNLREEGKKVCYEIHYLFADLNKELISENELVFRSQAELEQSLEDAGFAIESIYGNWDKSNVTKQSPELIFVAERR